MDIVASDFDGTIKKLPFPWNWFLKYCHPKDILERAKLHWIKKCIWVVTIYLPVILNGEVIQELQGKEVVIISGRRERTEHMEKKLKPYLNVKRYYWRHRSTLYEEIWKLKVLRFENIDSFYEDRKFVINYLRKAHVKVREV